MHSQKPRYRWRWYTTASGRKSVKDFLSITFAFEGRKSQVFLVLVGFTKRTQKTPIRQIDLAQNRLNDWMYRGIQSEVALFDGDECDLERYISECTSRNPDFPRLMERVRSRLKRQRLQRG